METISRRLANEKAQASAYVGQCAFAGLLGPEAAELCVLAIQVRYQPSLQMMESEMARIEQMRPEQPEILQSNYLKHLEACEAA